MSQSNADKDPQPPGVITLIVSPAITADGYHLDRFDASLDGELIVTSRQPLGPGGADEVVRPIAHYPGEADKGFAQLLRHTLKKTLILRRCGDEPPSPFRSHNVWLGPFLPHRRTVLHEQARPRSGG